MGAATSSMEVRNGTLRGAYAPPLPGTTLPPIYKPKQVTLTVPVGKKGGDTMNVSVGGTQRTVHIPRGKNQNEKFTYNVPGNTQKIFASTLHSIPGMEVAQSKPVIYGTVTEAYEWKAARAAQYTEGQIIMGSKVGTMMQEAQESILQQALQVGCNAVLGMQFTVSNDSSGEDGDYKMVNVTAYGTPCVVVPTSNLPIVEASAIVEPLYNSV